MDISEVKTTIYHLTHECYGESEITDAISALRKLCGYLDTGLTPEEITDHEEMFKAYRSVCGGKSPEEIAALQEKVKYAEFCAKSCLEYNQENNTLKKALTLAISHHADNQEATDRLVKYYIQQAQEQEEKANAK